MYAKWLKTSVRFVCDVLTSGKDVGGGVHIRPPLDDEDFHEGTRKLERPVPAPIRRFLQEAASCYHLEYWISIPRAPTPSAIHALGERKARQYSADVIGGRADICVVKDFARCQAAASGLSDDIGGPRTPLRDLLETSFPFLCHNGCDYIAIDTSRSEEGPVVWLSHEGDDPLWLAASFEDFLRAWEKLYYVGPHACDLEEYIDPSTGVLNATLPPAKALRKQIRDVMTSRTIE